MKTTVKKLSDTKVQLTISLGASELADAEQVSLTKLARDIKVPGFRKGKVPASIAAKHVDPNVLQEQILENALSKAVAEAFLQEKLQALDRPSVEVKKFVPGSELEFTAEVEVIPPVKLGDYKKLTAKKEVAKVEDKDVDEVIERIRKHFLLGAKIHHTSVTQLNNLRVRRRAVHAKQIRIQLPKLTLTPTLRPFVTHKISN
jgi:trigger factor